MVVEHYAKMYIIQGSDQKKENKEHSHSGFFLL